MPGLGIHRLLFAAVSLAGPRVDERDTAQGADSFEVEQPRVVGPPAFEGAGLDARHFRFQRRSPRLQAAIEHRLGSVAEKAEQEPQPRRHRTARVVVSDDFGVGVDTGPAHLTLELRGCRQRMAPGPLPAGDVLQVDKDRAGQVTALIFVATVASLQIPAEVDHPNAAVAQVLAQPVGFNQGTEGHQNASTRVS